MKKLTTILFALALSLPVLAQVDSLGRYKGLDSLLTQFYTALEHETLEAKGAEFDGLIETCKDSLTRQHVALGIFDHYRYSRVMGEEAVAIHIYDKWLATGKVKPRGEFDQMDQEMFVNLNRNSLIGMKALPAAMYMPCGFKMTVPRPGKISVLFFYDTSCAKCRLESQYLPAVLNKVGFKIDFCAIYTGSDKKSWKGFRRTFKIKNSNVRLINLWDPEMKSDYQRKYGVTGTPKIFVIMENGEIIGRRLEVENLQEMFHYISLSNGKKE